MSLIKTRLSYLLAKSIFDIYIVYYIMEEPDKHLPMRNPAKNNSPTYWLIHIYKAIKIVTATLFSTIPLLSSLCRLMYNPGSISSPHHEQSAISKNGAAKTIAVIYTSQVSWNEVDLSARPFPYYRKRFITLAL